MDATLKALKDVYLAVHYHNRRENDHETYVNWAQYEAQIRAALAEAGEPVYPDHEGVAVKA